MKKLLHVFLISMLLIPSGCTAPHRHADEPVTILLAAAASLEGVFVDELIPLFESENADIKVRGTYDSSGKLRAQIEAGLDADVFFSAARGQMDALADAGLLDAATVTDLLENKLVLIKPLGGATAATGFETVQAAAVIAIGDPESVPAGQYAREAFTALGNWDAVLARASLGTNVTQVLNWVAAASAEVGVVYATDAASSAAVEVISEAPSGALSRPVLYPIGIVAATKNRAAAERFLAFLASDEAMELFVARGFTPIS